MTAPALAGIEAAVDREAERGRVVELWWRDDDAVRDSPALDRLLALARRFDAPLSLAVIPGRVEPSLPLRLGGEERIDILAHGYEHVNHAPSGEKPSEYGAHRPSAAIATELARSLALARAAFGRQALPVFVPPWNRIAPSVEALLAGAGYTAVSAFGRMPALPGLLRFDTKLDPVDWRGSRSLASPETMTTALAAALAGGGRPIGLLTHHLVFDEPLWAWCEAWLELCARHPAVRLRPAAELIAGGPDAVSLSCGPPYGKVTSGLPLGGGAR